MSTEGPKRTTTEPTLVIDRSKLPPISSREVTAMGLDPDHPETRALLERNQYCRQEAETLLPCPRCEALPCTLCQGAHMVNVEQRTAWVAENEQIAQIITDPEEDPPAPEPPEAA